MINDCASEWCDLGPGKEYISKIDTNGTVLFKAFVPISSNYFDPVGLSMTQHSDNSYYLLTKSKLLHYSPSGQLLAQISTSLSNMTSVLALSNGKLFINGLSSTGRKNALFSSSGSFISQQACTNSITKFRQTSNAVFAITNTGILEKYDTSLVFQGATSLTTIQEV